MSVESAFVLIDRASPTIRAIRRELRELQADAQSAGRSLDNLSGPKLARQMEGQAREIKAMGRETDTTSRSLDNAGKSMNNAETRLKSLRQRTRESHLEFGILGKVISTLKWPALIAGAGGAVQVLGALTAGAVALLPKIIDLAGVTSAYGVTAVGLGESLGVVKLATQGLSQALAGNKRAIQQLTPEGRAFLQLLRQMHPELQRLRSSAQKGLFPGLGDLLGSLKSQAPGIQAIVRQTAGDLGGLGSFLAQQINSPRFITDLRTLGDEGSRAFGSAARGGFYFASAIEQVLIAAAPFTDWLGSTFVHLGKLAQQEAMVGRETGSLGSFFDRTKSSLQTMADTGEHVFGALRGIMDAARGESDSLWTSIDRTARRWDAWSNSVTGQTTMRRFFDDMRPLLTDTVQLFDEIVKGVAELTQGQQAEQMIAALRQAGPAIGHAIQSLVTNFGPVVVSSLSSVVTLLADLSTSAGPLTLVARAVGTIAHTIDVLLHALGPMGGVLTQAFGAFVLMKKLNVLETLDSLRAKWVGVGVAASGAAAAEERAAVAAGGGRPGAGIAPVPVATGVPGVPGAYNVGATASGLTVATEAEAAAAGAGGAAALSYLRNRGAISGEEAFAARFGNIPGARFGAPALGELSAAGQGAEGLGLLSRAGGVLRGAGGALGKIAGPLAALQAIFGFVGTQGNVANRSLGALNASTFGLGGKALNVLSGGIIPSAPSTPGARRTAGGRYAQNVIGGLNNSSSLPAQRRTISNLRTGIRLLPGNDSFDQNTHDLATATHMLQAELKRREAILRQSQQAVDRSLDEQSIRHADALVTDFTNAFGILRRAKGPQAAMRETVGHVIGEMRHMRKSGQTVLADSMLAWAHQQAHENPKLEGQYKDLIQRIKDHFTSMGKHIAIVNDTILTGSRTEWKNIGVALTNPVEKAREEVSTAFTQIQQQAIGSLTAMGFSPAEARQFVGNLEKGGSVGRATNALIGAGPGVTGGQVAAAGMGSSGRGSRRALGGRAGYRLPGTGTVDSVAMADGGLGAPGEAVLNRHTERDINSDLTMAGKPSVEMRLRGETRPHYALGGRGGSVILDPGVNMSVGQEPAILAALRKFSGEEHQRVYVISGYRSPAHSVAVGGFANDPHTTGSAADIGLGSPSLASMLGVRERDLNAVGLYRPFYPPSQAEANHVQLLRGGARGSFSGNLAAGIGMAAAQIAALRPPRSDLGGVPGALVNRAGQIYAGALTGKINQALTSDLAGIGGGGGNATANRRLGRAMMLARGWGAGQWPSLDALWTQESGWNDKALNPGSHAAGIPQELGHVPWQQFLNWGPRRQIGWGLDYIHGRYGSPAGAESHERQFNWYAGGTDMVVNRPTIFGAGDGGPERVRIGRPGAGGSPITIQRGAVQVNAAGGDRRAIQRYVDKRLRQFAEEVAAEIESGAEISHHEAIA